MVARSTPEFREFGPSRLRQRKQQLPEILKVNKNLKAARQKLRQLCPLRPGVYGMWDASGELIYVGKAKRLKARLLSYFAAKSSRDKAHRILRNASRIAWEYTPDEFGALVRELELIRRHRPRFNVQGLPGRFNRGYLCLGRSPAPYFYVATNPSSRTIASYGPMRLGKRSREIARRLNDLFQLRDCPQDRTMHFSDQLELFELDRHGACIRADIGTCLAPCIGGCSSEAYRQQQEAAQKLLETSDSSLIDTLRKRMLTAAANRQFEAAAQLRDTTALLEELVENMSYLKHVSAEFFFIYPVRYPKARQTYWYLIRGGVVVYCVRAPRCGRTAQSALQKIEEVFSELPSQLLEQTSDFAESLLTAGWFRYHPRELTKTLSPDQARHHCQQFLGNTTIQA